MKKIAIVMGHFGLKSGGVLSAVINIVNFLSKENSIHIYAGKDKFNIPQKLIENKNVNFSFFNLTHKGFLKIPKFELNSGGFKNFDFVWFHGAYMGWNKIASTLNCKYIYTPHGGYSNLINVDVARLLRRLFLFFFEFPLIRNAHFIQALSQSEYVFLKKINSRVKIIPNYIFKKKKIIYKKKDNKFCYIGRLDPSKNIELLLNISKNTKIIFDYYGYFTKSSSHNYQKKIKKNKLFYRNFYGSYKSEKELSQILNKYKYMIIPSKWEGMPIVIYEAIENGVIPIVSDQIKVPKFLQNYIIKLDISSLSSSIELIKKLNLKSSKNDKKLILNAFLTCKKELSFKNYNYILNIKQK